MARMAPKKYGSRIVQEGEENDGPIVVKIVKFSDVDDGGTD